MVELTPEQKATLAKLKRDNAMAKPDPKTTQMPKDKSGSPLPVVNPNG